MNSEREDTQKSKARPSEGTNIDRGADTEVERKSSRGSDEQSRTSDSRDLTSSDQQASSINDADEPVAEDVSRAVRRATGPRTVSGKMKSRLNSTKDGIFSKALVIHGESRRAYGALLAGLREDPEGALEDIFAEEMASIVWRRVRFFKAEGRDVKAIERRVRSVCQLSSLENCLIVLDVFRTSMQHRGFHSEFDRNFLKSVKMVLAEYYKVYNVTGDNVVDKLETTYERCLRISQLRDDERQKGEPSGTECRHKVLQAIDEEISRVKALKERHARTEDEATRFEKILLCVPQELESRMRYETHLDRLFERSFSRWERVRRMSLGQSGMPSLDVHIKE